ncbi:MAG: murein biosynthesis integral membrane protein MurJ [Clostridiales bacterium]|nr:murein biosynthesis integral membrane protein MurJ [Clostridiales bacterium]
MRQLSIKRSIEATVIAVMAITIISKLLGFARELFLSYYFGASGVSDAYLISLTIPGTIFQFVGTGLSTCFIPVYIKLKNRKGELETNGYTNSVLALILLFSTIVILAVWIWTEPVVKIFASGFEGQTLEYTIAFTRISVSSLYISTFIYVFNSLLQANNCFNPTAFAAIPNSAIVLLSIVIGAKINIYFMSIGTVVAILAQVVFMLPYARKFRFKPTIHINLRSTEMQQTYKLLVPVIIGVSVNEVNVLVDKTIASNISVGSISALSYANSLIMFVQGIFAQTIATVYYPYISEMVANNDGKKLTKAVNEAIGGMLLLLVPVTIGCMMLSNNVVTALYGRGVFDAQAINMTSVALVGYAVGIMGYGLREVLSRVYYSTQDTKTPTINAAIGVAINIVLNLTLSRQIGIAGLALATSISSITTSILLLRDLLKKKIIMIEKNLLVNLVKIVIVTGVMAFFIYLIKNHFINLNSILSLLIHVGGGVIVYFVLCLLLRVDYVNVIAARVRRKRSR